jgi:ADP-ribose pyrophosphatase YjhB (NUDIX family)
MAGHGLSRRMSDRRRYPPRPLVGVGALIFKGQHILLVERGKAPLKGYWSLPGGLIEVGEQLADAIRREVREETGLEVKPVSVVEIFERIIRDSKGQPEYHYVLIDYLCKVTGGELEASGDAAGAEWVRRKDLAARKLTDGTLDVIERAFARRAPAKRP